MFFLDGTEASKILCSCEYEPVWNIVGIVIDVIKIGIPIILIVLSMIDLAKAVIAGKEDEQKKATKLLGKRFLYAIGVFASVWLVTLFLDIVSDAFKNQESYKYDEGSWKACWAIIEHNACNSNTKIKKCYKCSYTSGTFYKFVLPENAHGCEEQSKYTDESSCKANNKGACYLCGQDNASGMDGYYEWRDAPVSGCKKQANITTPDKCNKLNSKN